METCSDAFLSVFTLGTGPRRSLRPKLSDAFSRRDTLRYHHALALAVLERDGFKLKGLNDLLKMQALNLVGALVSYVLLASAHSHTHSHSHSVNMRGGMRRSSPKP